MEVTLLTDGGSERSICGVVTGASQLGSDGGFATYRLVIESVLEVLARRRTCRVKLILLTLLLSFKPGFGSGPSFQFHHGYSGSSSQIAPATLGYVFTIPFQAVALLAGLVVILVKGWSVARLWKPILALTLLVYFTALAFEPIPGGFSAWFGEDRRADIYLELGLVLISAGVVILVLWLIAWAVHKVRERFRKHAGSTVGARKEPGPWRKAMTETGASLWLGLKDSLNATLVFRSCGPCALSLGFWALMYWKFSQEIFAAFKFIALFTAIGILQAAPGSSATTAVINPVALMTALVQIVVAVALIAAVIYVVLFALAIVGVIRVLLPWTIMPVARKGVALRYQDQPLLAQDAPRRRWKAALWLSALTLFALCIPVVSATILLLWISYLNVRLLYRSALMEPRSKSECPSFPKDLWKGTLLLGAFFFVLLFIPILNLIGPAWLCTSACHLFQRATRSSRLERRFETPSPSPGI